MTGRDLVTDSLRFLNIVAQGEDASDADAQQAVSLFNYMIDEWNARKVYAYNLNFALYTLIANHQPHTIGPTGADFNVPQRPVRIENAAIVLNASTSPVDIPVNIRDDDWWANQSVKEITSTVPTDLYYSPGWPNGALYLWPIPSAANGLRLETWQVLSEITLDTVITLPPGYKKALMLSLAEECIGPFGVNSPPPNLPSLALLARKTVQGNNDKSKRIASYDVGMPGGLRRGDFNYKSGTVPSE
jgi:hypothetical protein